MTGPLKVEEDHSKEQYFFDHTTLFRLTDILRNFKKVCCLACPRVAEELAAQGRPATLLDIDERFASIPGFRRWDLWRPHALEDRFDVILCDPPFWTVKLDQLHKAVRYLARWDFRQKLMITYLLRRSEALIGTFMRFSVVPTGEVIRYQTVKESDKTETRLYSNFDLQTLKAVWE